MNPGRLPLLLGHRNRDGGEAYHYLQAWVKPVVTLGEGSGDLQDTAPRLVLWSLNSPVDPGSGELEDPREKERIPPLTSLQMTTTSPTGLLAEFLINMAQ